jgi:hypothetical protein
MDSSRPHGGRPTAVSRWPSRTIRRSPPTIATCCA